jgi:serine/threonine protein kinase
MQNLKHANVMQLVELHESKNSIYLVVELLEGGELF